jgi:hypothetical protein
MAAHVTSASKRGLEWQQSLTEEPSPATRSEGLIQKYGTPANGSAAPSPNLAPDMACSNEITQPARFLISPVDLRRHLWKRSGSIQHAIFGLGEAGPFVRVASARHAPRNSVGTKAVLALDLAKGGSLSPLRGGWQWLSSHTRRTWIFSD